MYKKTMMACKKENALAQTCTTNIKDGIWVKKCWVIQIEGTCEGKRPRKTQEQEVKSNLKKLEPLEN